jgi:hypothetical protein
MKFEKIKKYGIVAIGALIVIYLISLLFLDTNSIVNCTGKDITGTLDKTYSIDEIAQKGRSLGYSVEHFPQDVTISKNVGSRYFQRFTLYSPKQEGTGKWNISATYGSGYCKIKDSATKQDINNFLTEFNIETEWLEDANIRVFDHRPMFDFLPHISL